MVKGLCACAWYKGVKGHSKSIIDIHTDLTVLAMFRKTGGTKLTTRFELYV